MLDLAAVDLYRKRGEPFPHTLFYGPPGVGKTYTALKIAEGTGYPYARFIAHSFDPDILSRVIPPYAIIIDEIHSLSRAKAEKLYPYLEKREGTILGCTTMLFKVPMPLRSRFIIVERMDLLEPQQIYNILKNKSSGVSDEFLQTIAKVAKGSVRNALNLLVRATEFKTPQDMLRTLEINEDGLTKLDLQYLSILKKMGTVSLSTLCRILSESEETVLTEVEPYLLRKGYIKIDSRGRSLGIIPPGILE